MVRTCTESISEGEGKGENLQLKNTDTTSKLLQHLQNILSLKGTKIKKENT